MSKELEQARERHVEEVLKQKRSKSYLATTDGKLQGSVRLPEPSQHPDARMHLTLADMQRSVPPCDKKEKKTFAVEGLLLNKQHPAG